MLVLVAVVATVRLSNGNTSQDGGGGSNRCGFHDDDSFER
jgi:hypothetical protein